MDVFAYEQIHTIKRNDEIEYRCAYSALGYELGRPTNAHSDLEEAIRELYDYKAKTYKIWPPFDFSTKSQRSAHEIRSTWRERVERSVEEKDGLYYDLDAFATVANYIASEPARYRLLDSEGALLAEAAEYVYDERRAIEDVRYLEDIDARLERLSQEAPTILSEEDATRIAQGVRYIKNVKSLTRDLLAER